MKTVPRLVAFVVSVACATLVAEWLAAFLEMDACLDAGGRFDAATGACDIASNSYVALFARPDLYWQWMLLLAATFCPAAGIYVLAKRSLVRILESGGTD